jgi:hypothetical protein
MATPANRSSVHLRPLWKSSMVCMAVVVGTIGLTSCSAIDKVKGAVDDIRSNKATIDDFSTKLQSGAATPFEATYVTTGNAPATIVYAVQPPIGVAFTETPSDGSGTAAGHIVVNSSGEFACTQPSSPGSQWTCKKVGTASAATENKIFDLYTPSHWIGFLKGFSLAAGLVGDKVTSSSMTVNGFAMSCVDFQASGVAGTSTICTTSAGILGYVNVASASTSFEIQSFSSTPSASLFELPPGATVTTVTSGTS